MHKILLVEDNELNRDMLARRLQRYGFSVVCAHDGTCGVAMTLSESPDLILMDLALGEMDGWQATRLIKANPTTFAIPIIALTAHALATDRAKSLEVSCSDFDTKPVDMERLRGKIQKLLPEAKKPNAAVACVESSNQEPTIQSRFSAFQRGPTMKNSCKRGDLGI